jgi:membrane fusion protein (multidrug efflux system)
MENDMPQTKQLSKAEKVVNVKSLLVKTKDLPIYKTYFGEVKFNQSVTLIAEMPGKIKALKVREGQRVKAGQTLLSYPRDANNLEIEEKQIEQAQISLRDLEKNYARQKRLYEKGAVNRVSVETLETQIDVQKNAIEQLQLGVQKNYIIKAPFSGILTAVPIEKGQQLQLGTLLFTLSKSSDVEVEFYVLPKDAKDVRVGSTIEIIDDGQLIRGKIKEKATQLDGLRKAIKTKAVFNKNAKQLLVGSTVELRILKETIPNALVIPEEIITQRGQSYYVYAIREGKSIKQKIKIAKRIGLEVLVKEGIQKGDELVSVGMNKLKNNTAVAVVK